MELNDVKRAKKILREALMIWVEPKKGCLKILLNISRIGISFISFKKKKR